MKKTKQKSIYNLGDFPSGSGFLSKRFLEIYSEVYFLLKKERGFVEESRIKKELSKKLNISEDSVRKNLRDFRFLELIGKIKNKIFITEIGNIFLDNLNNNVFMVDWLARINAPSLIDNIDMPWLETIEELHEERKIQFKNLIYLYLMKKDELQSKDFLNIFNKYLKDKSINIEWEKSETKNRLSHLKSLFKKYKYYKNNIEEPKNSNLKNQTLYLSSIRKLQSKFRNDLIKETGGKSMIKKISNYKLMIASHIVDYKDCKGTSGEHSKDNGLFLLPNIDKLFDLKIITFSLDGDILCNSKDIDLLKKFGLKPSDSLPKKFLNKNRSEFLKKRNLMYFKDNLIKFY